MVPFLSRLKWAQMILKPSPFVQGCLAVEILVRVVCGEPSELSDCSVVGVVLEQQAA